MRVQARSLQNNQWSHWQDGLAVSALEGPIGITCRASFSLCPRFSWHCPFGIPAVGGKAHCLGSGQLSLLGLLTDPRPPRVPTWDQRIGSHFLTNIPSTQNPELSVPKTIVLCQFILLSSSLFLIWNMPSKGPGELERLALGASRMERRVTFVPVAVGCAGARNKFKCFWDNEQELCVPFKSGMCVAVRDPGQWGLTGACGNEMPRSWFYDGFPPFF